MAAHGLQPQLTRTGPQFLAASLVLHAGLIYAVARYAETDSVPEDPSAQSPPILWLERFPLDPAPPHDPAIESVDEPELNEPSPPTDERPPDRQAEIERDVEVEVEVEVETEAEPAIAGTAPPSGAEAEPPRAAEPTPPETTEIVTADEPTIPGIDFEAERARAVALVIEQQQREQRYRTFSLDDLIDEPPPEEPSPDVDVFAGPSSSGPSLLRPSQARTRIGRALLEFCNQLTGGGIGIGFGGFGIGICGEDGPRADFFGHLRPAYMEMLPVCTEQELTEAQLAAAEIDDPSDIETTVVKCRLVDRDAVIVVPEF